MKKFFLVLLAVMVTSVLFAGSFSLSHSYSDTKGMFYDSLSISDSLTDELSYRFYYGSSGTSLKFSYEGLFVNPWIEFGSAFVDYSNKVSSLNFDDKDRKFDGSTDSDYATGTAASGNNIYTVSLGGTFDFDMVVLPFSVSFGMGSGKNSEEIYNPADAANTKVTTATDTSSNSFSVDFGTDSDDNGGITTGFATILPKVSYSTSKSKKVTTLDAPDDAYDLTWTHEDNSDSSLDLYLGVNLESLPVEVYAKYNTSNNNGLEKIAYSLASESTTTSIKESIIGFGASYEEEFFGFDLSANYSFSMKNKTSDEVRKDVVGDTTTSYSTNTIFENLSHSFSVSAEKTFSTSATNASFYGTFGLDLLTFNYSTNKETVTYEDNDITTPVTKTEKTTEKTESGFKILSWNGAYAEVGANFDLAENVTLKTKTKVYDEGFKWELPTVVTLAWTPSDALYMSVSARVSLAELVLRPVPYFITGNTLQFNGMEGESGTGINVTVSYSW